MMGMMNPQMQRFLEQNPEISQSLRNPEFIRRVTFIYYFSKYLLLIFNLYYILYFTIYYFYFLLYFIFFNIKNNFILN
jgi:hypothetical protein